MSALTPGTRLIQYEVVESIGVGGMGEVYRARDAKLDREVAIKVLPEALSDDKERLARFEREAKLLAQLNHANIATLHGLEEFAGRKFLVMELVEGETLAEQIARGPIQTDEARLLFIQIAEGLEAAHEKGIIHRDLKPANIKITPDGKVKILDFGLAKAFAPQESETEDSSQSPTLTKGTALGAIMGTASYMSPEQARGKPVDKRTDIWAYGVCFFETLSGWRPFDGETVTDIIAAVVHREPDWNLLPASTPWRVRELIERCVQKKSRDRLRDIGDSRIQLESTDTEPRSDVPVAPSRRYVHAFLGLLVGAIVAAAAAYVRIPEPPSSVPVHFREPLPDQVGQKFSPPLVLSPDGKRAVLASGLSLETTELHFRSFEEINWHLLADTKGGDMPFFSPDGEWIGYFANGELKKVSASGGIPVTIGRVQKLRAGATWGPDDTIVFSSAGAGLTRISAGEGASETLTTLAPDEGQHWWPQFLPDGSAIVFTVTKASRYHVAVLDMRTGKYRILEELGEGRAARYVPTGHLVYVDARGRLHVSGFDASRMEVTSSPVPVSSLDDIYVAESPSNLPYFTISNEGHLAYLAGAPAERTLVLVDRDGVSSPLVAAKSSFRYPRISPDGTRVAVEGGQRVWIYDLASGTRSPLTARQQSMSPVWGPEPDSVTFTTGFYRSIHWTAIGASTDTQLLSRENPPFPAAWSPGAEALVFEEFHPDTQGNILVSTRQGDVRPLLASEFGESQPDLSPDGHWLAYESDESGQFEIYVDRFPDLGERVTVSVEGGREPLWSTKGDKLFYRHEDRMMAVSVHTTTRFRASRPRELFRGPFLSPATVGGVTRTYDVAPDGEHFLMLEMGDAEGKLELRVVLNWFEELKRLVSADN